MSDPALDLYESGLDEIAVGSALARLVVRMPDGSALTLPLERWLGSASPADEAVLGRCRGPVLDVGCGPGRHVHALARAGVLAMGVDISPAAVALTRRRGAHALKASVFDQLPGAGTWKTALLLDGNIGIGGHPGALLRRVASLLSPDGEVLIEIEAPGTPTFAGSVRLESGRHRISEAFRWARVGVDDIGGLANQADMRVLEQWEDDERWFVRVARGPGRDQQR
jgi:SAM-dependent methyltransferase